MGIILANIAIVLVVFYNGICIINYINYCVFLIKRVVFHIFALFLGIPKNRHVIKRCY